MKFKVGDKIKIIPPKDWNESPGFNGEMFELSKTPQTLVKVHEFRDDRPPIYYILNNSGGYWTLSAAWVVSPKLYSSGGNI